MNAIKQAMDQASELILNGYRAAAAKGLLPDAELPRPVIEVPKDPKNGDYASSFAMQSARALHMAPVKSAQAICENVDLTGTVFSSDAGRACCPGIPPGISPGIPPRPLSGHRDRNLPHPASSDTM